MKEARFKNINTRRGHGGDGSSHARTPARPHARTLARPHVRACRGGVLSALNRSAPRPPPSCSTSGQAASHVLHETGVALGEDRVRGRAEGAGS
jgi:hypothetical protein